MFKRIREICEKVLKNRIDFCEFIIIHLNIKHISGMQKGSKY